MVTTRASFGTSLLLAAALAAACSEPEEAADSAAASSPSRTSPRGAPASPADLDLEAMLYPVPEYEGVGRNLFAYGAARIEEDPGQGEEPPAIVPAPTEIVALPPRASQRPA